MNKLNLIKALLEELEKKHLVLSHSALDAKEAATNEESKPENKYDTRALEASYLASAQSLRVEELKRSINGIQRLEMISFALGEPIKIGALVLLTTSSNHRKWVFLLPHGGGEKLKVEDEEVVVLTPESPLGKRLMGKTESDEFEFMVKKSQVEYQIIKVL